MWRFHQLFPYPAGCEKHRTLLALPVQGREGLAVLAGFYNYRAVHGDKGLVKLADFLP